MNRLERSASYPMTGSSAEYLAGLYGQGMSLQEMADLLPRYARIIDIASGLSDFGIALATLREDIEVVGLDIQYKEKSDQTAEALGTEPPANFRYVKADALSPEGMEGLKGKFDYAFSYNFYSHVMRADRPVGEQALRGAMSLLKPYGSLFVGPTNSRATSEDRWATVVIDKRGSEAKDFPFDESIRELARAREEEALGNAIAALTTPAWATPVYDAMSATGVGIYPAQRFDPNAKGLVLSRDGGKTRERLSSFEGLKMASRLGARAMWEIPRFLIEQSVAAAKFGIIKLHDFVGQGNKNLREGSDSGARSR